MPRQTCTATNKSGEPCWAVTWVLQLGTGLMARTIGKSEDFCIRHDLNAYNELLGSLDQSQANRLRYATDRKRWSNLVNSPARQDPDPHTRN